MRSRLAKNHNRFDEVTHDQTPDPASDATHGEQRASHWRTAEELENDHASRTASQRYQRHDLSDPTLANWFIDKLVGTVMGEAPIGPGACYLAINLRRHLDERARDVAETAEHVSSVRMARQLDDIRKRLHDGGLLAERLEVALGQLIAVSGGYRRLAARELTRSLEILRAHLERARAEELEIAMRAHWDDIGGSG